MEWDHLQVSICVVGHMSLTRAGEQITPVVEMTRNAEVKRGAPEQQKVIYQEGNRTQGDTECQKCN